MNKKILLISSLVLILLVLVLLPTLKGFLKPAPPISPYEEFGAFIPFTMGYFPENFTILTADTLATHEANFDRFEEWYTSDQYFIKIIQVQGLGRPLWDQLNTTSQSLFIQEQYAEIIVVNDKENWVGDEFNLSEFDTKQMRTISFFLKEIRIQIVSNLPEDILTKVAENIVPSICLNPTEVAP